MKLMPALPESIFDIFYLAFAVISGILLMKKAEGRLDIKLMGIATLVLGCGDAFHLVPRVLDYWISGDFTAALGIGKLVTSVTMTAFYLLLEYVRINRYHEGKVQISTKIIWVLAVVRVILCAFSQNAWTSADAPVSWGIYRNVPFVVIGVMTEMLWIRDARNDNIFRLMPIAVILSFVFYIPVVLFAHMIPMMGMLMLPKTVMYIWIICMFKKAETPIPGSKTDK